MSSTSTPNWRDTFSTRKKFKTKFGEFAYYSLPELAKKFPNINTLPYSIKVLLEAVLRNEDGFIVEEKDITNLANWNGKNVVTQEIPFKPARVVVQDFTGVPAVVDLAAMRDALNDLGADPKKINPVLPVDLVIDHSVQVDQSGNPNSLQFNSDKEFERNIERYEFLRWGSDSFSNFQVVPPATGIVHQVNLEYLAKVVQSRKQGEEIVVYPDSLVGTDSHTTMINGLGVLGWGVGGIEAEAVMLEQPVYMLIPEVIGFRICGKLPEDSTATDLVLTIVEKLRQYGVVGKFVEFYGPGITQLSLADRATIANMAPEYGATTGFFPVDDETLKYMKLSGRDDSLIELIENYHKAQEMFASSERPEAHYTDVIELDISNVEPSTAGPKRPQDRILLKDTKSVFYDSLSSTFNEKITNSKPQNLSKKMSQRTDSYSNSRHSVSLLNGKSSSITHGSIVVAAITSCTNTSNPSVMVGAGLVAQKAIEKGLKVPPHVKTSLAPGSQVVTGYLDKSGLTKALDKIGFHTVGYGCTTCIGNSGPIDPAISKAINDHSLVATSVLSGNRNFEGRIHADIRANYLVSPPLVVIYALAGTVDIDLYNEPLGKDKNGNSVYMSDIWPSPKEIEETIEKCVSPELFRKKYGKVFTGNPTWNKINTSKGDIYSWSNSTYIRKPTFFEGITMEIPRITPIKNARVLAKLGDSITTDHISPAGAIKSDSPAGKWLQEQGVEPKDFNTYGSRRGNHEVMVRGTFANIRIKNQLTPTVEGGYTRYLPDNEEMSIYDAAIKYKEDSIPLIILSGKEYGTGSSRDWAAKGTSLLGVKAVIAESFERIHRSNLIGMGVFPLQFKSGESSSFFDLTGEEIFDILGINDNIKPQQLLKVTAKSGSNVKEFETILRADTPVEVEYLRNGGILHTVLRKLGA